MEAVFERAVLCLLAAILVALPVFIQQGLYQAIIRFIGSKMVFGVLRGVSIVALMVAFHGADDRDRILYQPTVLTMALIFWAFALLGIVGSRFIMRSYLMRKRLIGERVAVYGAGEAGVNLVSSLAGGQKFAPVAYLDDSLALQGRSINGLQVYSPEVLTRLVRELSISRVLLALPSASRWKTPPDYFEAREYRRPCADDPGYHRHRGGPCTRR